MTRNGVGGIHLVCLAGAIILAAGDGIRAAEKPELDELYRTADKSAERLKSDPASWTMVRNTASGQIAVDVVRHGDDFRWIAKIQTAEGSVEAVRIICHEGIWYVTTGKRTSKFKPFEATNVSPTVFAVLSACNPHSPRDVFTDPLEIRSWNESQVILHGPLIGMVKDLIDASLVGLGKADAADPNAAATREQLEEMKQNGTEVTVERDTGFVTKVQMTDPAWSMENFKWLDTAPTEALQVKDQVQVDETRSILELQRGENFLMTLFPSVDAAANDGLGNVMLINRLNGQFRRVPCRRGTTTHGCFSADRTKVYVVGLHPDRLLNQVVEVDLATGANYEVCPDLQNSMTVYPALSPDGKKLAVLRHAPGMPVEQTRVCVIDLAARMANDIGSPGDYKAPEWLPDATGFILTRTERLAGAQPITTLCRLSLNGNMTSLRPVFYARILGDQPRIIFQEKEGGEWKSCDLQGGDVQRVGDGLLHLSYAAPGRSGKAAILVSTLVSTTSDGFRAFLVDLATSKRERIPLPEGFWWLPSWR